MPARVEARCRDDEDRRVDEEREGERDRRVDEGIAHRFTLAGGVLVVLVAGAENAELARALLRREGYAAPRIPIAM